MWDKLSQVVYDYFSHLHIIWRSATINCKNAKNCVHKWKLKQLSTLTNSQLLRQSLHYFEFSKFGSSNLNLFSPFFFYFEKGFGLFEPFNSVSKITAVARLVLTDFDLADRDMFIYER